MNESKQTFAAFALFQQKSQITVSCAKIGIQMTIEKLQTDYMLNPCIETPSVFFQLLSHGFTYAK